MKKLFIICTKRKDRDAYPNRVRTEREEADFEVGLCGHHERERILEIEIPDDAIEKLFAPSEVIGEIE